MVFFRTLIFPTVFFLDPNGFFLDPNGFFLDPNGSFLDPDRGDELPARAKGQGWGVGTGRGKGGGGLHPMFGSLGTGAGHLARCS